MENGSGLCSAGRGGIITCADEDGAVAAAKGKRITQEMSSAVAFDGIIGPNQIEGRQIFVRNFIPMVRGQGYAIAACLLQGKPAEAHFHGAGRTQAMSDERFG